MQNICCRVFFNVIERVAVRKIWQNYSSGEWDVVAESQKVDDIWVLESTPDFQLVFQTLHK